MKKMIILFLMITSIIFGIEVIDSSDILNSSGKVIGETYIANFANENEKNIKMQREKKYLQSKDDFKVFISKNGGVMYMASYSASGEYTISFKGFCGDIYISVYGNYANFDEIKNIFLNKTDSFGYDFK
ncbi:hypothetical protein H3N56_10390 [Cetobacterium sp. 2A]|uniref:hypothetical protein n=1 Tax=Cetobacterium sp. 2A TaxID=2754723 RepID=UPI00163BEE96|nr:hypothetical protein [Cetobacterium sp. 2A]MBC2855314.1 hypothetical protein [Cetobacterium sp. 2A]MBC2856808.1 hypothetical protein [Cetobacterium sp. 2A]MBC2856849.1 hypothetical protein [Cetobacterium sp. 2A]